MRALVIVIVTATLAGCGSVSDRSRPSGTPTNPFASNYPSVDPGAVPARRRIAAPRPPGEVPF